MQVLVLGGTNFIGRILVEKLLERKDLELTLFNRGQTNADLYPNVRKLKGDRRAGEIGAILEENWDVIFDVSCYQPNPLEKLISDLKGKVKRYIFVSTVSVYPLAEYGGQLVNETMNILPCSQESKDAEEIMPHYGAKKVACEQILQNAEWLDSIILRPSIVYGRFDPYDRHYYWLYRYKTQDSMLFPDKGTEQMSFTYVEDLCRILVQAIDIKEHRGVYNVANPEETLKGVLDSMQQAVNRNPKRLDVDLKWVEANELVPHRDISLWSGATRLRFDNEKITKDFQVEWTSAEEAMKQTASYYENLNWPVPSYGMAIDKEQDLIKKLGH